MVRVGKGNSVIEMNRTTYVKKLNVLDPQLYRKLNKDPTTRKPIKNYSIPNQE